MVASTCPRVVNFGRVVCQHLVLSTLGVSVCQHLKARGCQHLPTDALSITRRILKLRVVPFGTVLDLRTTTSQNCVAIPRRDRLEGSKTFVSLNSGWRVIKKKKKDALSDLGVLFVHIWHVAAEHSGISASGGEEGKTAARSWILAPTHGCVVNFRLSYRNIDLDRLMDRYIDRSIDR